MRKIVSTAVVAAVAVVATPAPAQADTGTKEILGTMLGGAVGGLAGSRIGKGTGRLAATAGGAVLGAIIGNGAGGSLDRADRLYQGGGYYGGSDRYGRRPDIVYTQPPVVYAPPVHVERRVYRPVTVYDYYGTPAYRGWGQRDYGTGRDYRGDYGRREIGRAGQHCREYQSQVTVGGLPQPAYGVACLQPDGSWRIVE